MKAQLATALRQQFRESLRQIFPKFREERKCELPPGWRAFRCEDGGGFFAFVILCLSPKDDRFTIEIAWSTDGIVPTSPILETQNKITTKGSIRLSSLWHPQRIDFWWSIGKQQTLEEMANFLPEPSIEEKLSDIDSKLSDAIAKLEDVGIPYLRQKAADLGLLAQCFESDDLRQGR